MATTTESRTKELSMVSFWNIIFPIIVLLLLLFVLFVVYTMPDWSLECSAGLEPLRRVVREAS